MSATLIRAFVAGIVGQDEFAAILHKATRHPGGRPKGSKNKPRCQKCKQRVGVCKCSDAEIVEDALDKAVVALSKVRENMTPAERAMSERRMTALFTNKSGFMPFNDARHANKAEMKDLAARALPEEQAVADVYRRQEDREGKARKRKVRKVAISKGGEVIVGYTSDAEPSIVNFTDRGLAGKRPKRPWMAPVPEGTGGCWRGLDDLAPECQGERQKLAGVMTREGFVVGKSKMDRIPRGGYEYAVPEPTVGEAWEAFMADTGRESDWSECQPDPNVPVGAKGWFGKGSCKTQSLVPEAVRAAYTVKVRRVGPTGDPLNKWLARTVRGADGKPVADAPLQRISGGMITLDYACCHPKLVFEGTGVPAPNAAKRRFAKKRPIQSIYRDQPYDSMTLHLVGRKAPLASHVARVRSAGECRAGRPETRWRKDRKEAIKAIVQQVATGRMPIEKAIKATKKAERWLKPVGMLPEPPAPLDAEMAAAVEVAKAVEHGRSIGLKARWNALGVLAGRALSPMIVYHSTERSVLTPQIKEAVMAVYGRPLPRSPLLPR